MTTLRESYLYHLWAALCTVYYDSGVHRCLVRMGAWCNRQIDESRLLHVLCREGVVARAWEGSFLCRLLTALVNLPAWLLHKLYLALKATFDDSFFSRLAFGMGHETAIAQSWLIMLLWIIPFSHWNNAYSMLGFAALLVLFCAGAMSRKAYRLDVKHIGFYPVVLFGSMFLAVLFSYEPSASFRFLLYHIAAALCVLVTVSAVRGTEDLKRLAAGGGFCVLVSSLYSMFISSVFIDLLHLVYTFEPMEPFLACVFGGVLMGASLGVVFLQGATTGGTDLAARLLKLVFKWLPMGKLLLAVDLIVVVSVALSFQTINTALYGLVALYISTLALDGVLYGMDTAKVAYIISDHNEEIRRTLVEDLDKGVTILHGQGAYTGAEKQVLLCAFKQREIATIKSAVKGLDPNAFLIVCDAHEVLGEGFQVYHSDGL